MLHKTMTQFIWPIRVYYEDTDAGGVVYHANYLNFLERARTEALRAKGLEHDELLQNAGIIFVVRSLSIDYVTPAKFNDLIEVSTEIGLLRKASLTFTQTITRGEVILCKAIVNIACVAADTFRPKAIPVNLIAQLQ